MRIVIDTNGSITKCTLYECVQTTSDSKIDPHKGYSFKEADIMSQLIALKAFRTIEKEFDKNKEVTK